MSNTPILTDADSAARFAGELQREKVIAVDLEADSMHCYREKVCLLQFSTLARTVLVDPLAVSDLSMFKPVMSNPAVRKLFHAADYDIRCLYRDFGIEVRGLFDTMVACQFVGAQKVGLADVLNKFFGIELDKQYQRADWSLRPLPGEMVRYAAEDTRHLHRLTEVLEKMLADKGRLSWVAEEFSLLESVRHREAEGPFFLRAKGAGVLDRRQLAVFEELLKWRDGEAQRRDCPLFKVVGNKTLIEAARHAPHTLRGLVGLTGFSPRLVDRYGKAILKAIEAGAALSSEQLPYYPRNERPSRDPRAEKLLGVLKSWRKEVAEGLQMDPGILINNALLEEIARLQPRTAEEFEGISNMKNWQREVLGKGIIEALGM